MRKGHQFHAAIGEKLLKIGQIKAAGRRVKLPFAHLDPLIGQTPPDTRIGLMVLIGHHNRPIGAAQPLPHRLGQHIGVGTGRGAKADLFALDAHHRPKPRARLIHLGSACLRPRIRAIGLHLAVGVEPVQPVHHLRAGV